MQNHDNDSTLKFGTLTETIIGCSFEVINDLGAGFLESVYAKSLAIALQERSLKVRLQHPIQVHFRNQVVGDFYADLFVEDKVLLELKVVKSINPEHKAQIINYLKATGVDVGLLINFGSSKLEYQRFTRNK